MARTETEQQSEIVIVGGGMIGSCLALALSRLPYRVTMIEPFAPTNHAAPGFDARAIALSRSSAKILDSLGIWQPLKQQVTPIKDIHISDKGRSGICRLSASEVNIPAMGYVVELTETGKVLQDALQQSDVTVRCPAKVSAMSRAADHWQLTIDEDGQQHTISAALVIAADGSNSTIRDMTGVQRLEKTYRQDAIISTIQTQLAHNHQAFERFTDDGPVAMLPLSDNRISLVWMLPPDRAELMVNSSDEDFLDHLQQAFGYRLGRLLKVGERHRYPLRLCRTSGECERVIFVGNAAQSLHPIAGQGFNLGLRDVADLVDVLYNSAQSGQSLTDASTIADTQSSYRKSRQQDNELIVTMTDGLARLFANPSRVVSVPRNLILHLLATSSTARHEFGRFAMGQNHPAARLTRGIPIDLGVKQ